MLIWNPARLSNEGKKSGDSLCQFAAAGGRIVVLSTEKWSWKELCDLETNRMGGSRVFAYDDAMEHWLLRGVDAECLKRWNGLPGTVAVASIEGPAVKRAKKILWVREPKHTVVAEATTATGDGSLLFSQLDLRRHVIRSHPDYDPAAERILLNMLSEG